MEKKPPKPARITLKYSGRFCNLLHYRTELNFFFPQSSKNSQDNGWKVNSICVCSTFCHLSPSFFMSAEELELLGVGGGAGHEL